jgi:predicted metal-dependent HD superfamily phosphohydrolase
MDYIKIYNDFAGVVGVMMLDLPYHNFRHVNEVAEEAMILAREEGFNDHEVHLFGYAGLGHDVEQTLRPPRNEIVSAYFSRDFLMKLSVPYLDAFKIHHRILGTIVGHPSRDLEQQIMADADLAHLGKDVFMERNGALAQEWNKEIDRAWYVDSLKFMDSHEFQTTSARRLYNAGKEANMELLRRRIRDFKYCGTSK